LPSERFLRVGAPWRVDGSRRSAELAHLHGLELNFDPAHLSKAVADPWHIDDYCRPLPAEAQGDPVPEGCFEIAKRLLCDYEFADPRRVRAYYLADAPLLGRDMLLEIRYFGLRVRVGVRVGAVFDEVRRIDGRAVRLWGWAYRTLEGHLERGQMDYQVWKWLDKGEVEFRIHAVSQLAEIRSPVLGLGFRLVGRRQQVEFARRCGARMEQLVRARLRGARPIPKPTATAGILVSPSGESP
jgi:uncharacterized protein (UPF0548 family)